MRRIVLACVMASSFLCAQTRPAPRSATANAPGKPAISFEQLSKSATEARDANRNDEAIQLFQECLKLKPDWDEGLWYLGTLFYETERYREAVESFRHFLAQNRGHGPGWALLGLAEYKCRQYDRALEHLRQAQSLGVGDRKELADAMFYHVAVLESRFEQFHDSLKLLWMMRAAGYPEKVIEQPAGLAALGYALLPEEIPPDRRELARLAGAAAFAMLDQRRPDEEKLFRVMIDQYPNEPGVHYQYGLFLIDEQEEAGARELKREIEITPSHIPARLRLAEYYIKQAHPEEAKALIEAALRLEPKEASGHMLLGEILAAQGDNAGAIRELESARDLEPDRPKIRWDLLRAYKAARRNDDAEKERAAIEKLSKEQNRQ